MNLVTQPGPSEKASTQPGSIHRPRIPEKWQPRVRPPVRLGRRQLSQRLRQRRLEQLRRAGGRSQIQTGSCAHTRCAGLSGVAKKSCLFFCFLFRRWSTVYFGDAQLASCARITARLMRRYACRRVGGPEGRGDGLAHSPQRRAACRGRILCDSWSGKRIDHVVPLEARRIFSSRIRDLETVLVSTETLRA